MRTAQLENQNGLAGAGGKEVKERGLGLVPLAGFEVTTEGDGAYYVAFHEFVKSVMLSERRYYKEAHSPIMNLFDCGSEKNSSHFTSLRILFLLLLHRGENTTEGKGYFELAKAAALFEDIFDNREGLCAVDESFSGKAAH